MLSKKSKAPLHTWLACALTIFTTTGAIAGNSGAPPANQAQQNPGINTKISQWAEKDQLLVIYRNDVLPHGAIKDKMLENNCKILGWVMNQQHIEGISVSEDKGNGITAYHWEYPMLIETQPGKINEVSEILKQLPGIVSCAPNYYLYSCGQSSPVSEAPSEKMSNQFQKGDPFYQNEWYLPALRVPNLQHHHFSMRIGLIDAGCRTYVPELKKGGDFANKQDGYDATTGSTFGDDTIGHGTMVATTMVAIPNNGIGTTGICRNRNVQAIKAINEKGLCTDWLLYKGLAKYGAHTQAYHNNIISVSFNAPGTLSLTNESTHPAFNRLAKFLFQEKSCLIFLPSGNFGGVDKTQDKEYLQVITALDQEGKISTKSTRGNGVDFCSPGMNIVCTDHNGATTAGNGTCFAAASAAAAAAVVEDAADYYKWGAYPGHDTLQGTCDIKWLLKILRASAYTDGIEGTATDRGRGCIDVKKAIEMIKKQHQDTIAKYQELGMWK